MKTVGQLVHDGLQPGTILRLENGKVLLVGHVNEQLGLDGHCLTDLLQPVDTGDMLRFPEQDDPGWCTPTESPLFKDKCSKCSECEGSPDLIQLWWCDIVQRGDLCQMANGEILLIGDINPKGGTCDHESRDFEDPVTKIFHLYWGEKWSL